MYYPSPAYLHHLETRIQQLEEDNENLKKQLNEIKPVHIENINYKIQELTVQELTGTLNIGMSAFTDAEEIKKWLHENEGEDVNVQESDGDESTKGT